MQIQINTDHNIHGHQEMIAQVSDSVEKILRRFRDHITRVDIHLSDVNSDKKSGYGDMRCTMEARLERRKPIAVAHQANTLDQAVDGAADKLANMIESTLGRMHDQKNRRTDPPLPEPKLTEPS